MSGDTLLDAINRCHNHDPWSDHGFVKLVHDPAGRFVVPSRHAALSATSQEAGACVIGFVARPVLAGLAQAGVVASFQQNIGARTALVHVTSQNGEEALFLHPAVLSYDERTKQMASISATLRTGSEFPHVKAGWRNELYTVYGPTAGRKLFSVERSVCSLFGFATYGVHATAFTRDSDQELYFWVPKRSATKQTWPGMLDNTVAGGLSAGEKQLDAMVREFEEEAGLLTELVQPRLRPVGALSYFYLAGRGAGGAGLSQPEVQYLYDLELPSDVKPHPVDGEAEEFKLLSISQVLEAIRTRQFKPNCALVYIDFFLRHGILTPETEPDYALLLPRLHADLGMATP